MWFRLSLLTLVIFVGLAAIAMHVVGAIEKNNDLRYLTDKRYIDQKYGLTKGKVEAIAKKYGVSYPPAYVVIPNGYYGAIGISAKCGKQCSYYLLGNRFQVFFDKVPNMSHEVPSTSPLSVKYIP